MLGIDTYYESPTHSDGGFALPKGEIAGELEFQARQAQRLVGGEAIVSAAALQSTEVLVESEV